MSRRALRIAERIHADIEPTLEFWYKSAKKAEWNSLADVRRSWPSADQVQGLTVFDIKGNAYRLITYINYRTHIIYIKHVLTHAEYDKGRWKR